MIQHQLLRVLFVFFFSSFFFSAETNCSHFERLFLPVEILCGLVFDRRRGYSIAHAITGLEVVMSLEAMRHGYGSEEFIKIITCSSTKMVCDV